MAKNTAKTTASAKSTAKKAVEKAVKHEMSYGDKKAERLAEVTKEFGGLLYHTATISGGKKFRGGTKVEAVLWVGVNKYLVQTTQCMIGGEKEWVDPKFLTKGKSITAAQKAVYEAAREEESSKTLLTPATCRKVSQSGEAFLLSSPGWARDAWFPATMAEKVGYCEPSKLDLWEVPAWKVRKEQGALAVEALEGKQEALTEFVGKTAPAVEEEAA